MPTEAHTLEAPARSSLGERLAKPAAKFALRFVLRSSKVVTPAGILLVAGCGDGAESASRPAVENTFQATGDLVHGGSETVEGSFVTDAEVHCHFHDGMTLEVAVDHTATAEAGQEPRTIEVTMTDNAFGPDQVEVGHGESISFEFSNDGQAPHNAILTDPAQAEGGPHTDH